jgi:hypothetical protein
VEQLDVRQPMGLLFLLLSIVLIGHGFAADPAIYVRHSLGQNVNVTWGVIFGLFGGVMLWLAAQARR